MPPTRAVVLLSGGLDSSTALAVSMSKGREVYALTVDYGQRHRKEIHAARKVARHFRVKEHKVLRVDLRAIGGSALTDDRMAVPEKRGMQEMMHKIPPTYVPARNTILLGLALAYAESMDADEIYVAANAVDYSVSGDAQIWVRTGDWAGLTQIKDLCALPEEEFETVSVNPRSLRLEWRRVTGRFRHPARAKRSFRIRLERGQELIVTEDHSLYTLDLATARLSTIRGTSISVGMPIVAPFDLSEVSSAWESDLKKISLQGISGSANARLDRTSFSERDGYVTNRLGLTRVPTEFPVDDDFLYIVGLWLAEGGKEKDSRNTTLGFSVGDNPEAVKALKAYFRPFGINVAKSPANDFDYWVPSSVFTAVFRQLGLLGTSKRGEKAFPPLWWNLSQRQRRLVIAGLWDGDGSHVFKGEGVLVQKSHALVSDAYHSFLLDGIFPSVKIVRRGMMKLTIGRAQDFRRFSRLYPMRHPSKHESLWDAGSVEGRDQATGIWKCPGLWSAVRAAELGPGVRTRIYNAGGKYDHSFRSRRSAFEQVPSLKLLVESRLAFLRVTEIEEMREDWMFDLSVESNENFVANGILAHNSGYPDCRPEYYEAFRTVARLGTKRGVEGRPTHIHTPLIHMTKADIVRRGAELGVPFDLTWSCYHGRARACGVCDSCQLRLKGFREAGIEDPLPYGPRPRNPLRGDLV